MIENQEIENQETENEVISENEELAEESVKPRLKWSGFVESSVVDFFMGYKLEKMSIEDGNGNKAKLSLTKDNGIKVEYSSTTIL